MSENPLLQLTTTGRPEHQQLEGNIRRALDQTRRQIQDAETYVIGGTASWANPQPTTQDEALDRLSAAVAGLLGTPVP